MIVSGFRAAQARLKVSREEVVEMSPFRYDWYTVCPP